MKKKTWIWLGLFLALFIYYFMVPVNIFWDTGHYTSFVAIFEGKLPWNSWDIVRGPVFPLLLYISNFLFGKTTQGILILTFLFYITMLIVVKKILDNCLTIKNEKNKKIVYSLIFVVLIVDPIIYGYYHALLTEFVAMTISLMMCYLSWKWLDVSFCENKKRYLTYSLIFFIGTIISWHLKQPYVTITIFPVIISSIISIIKNHNVKNTVQRGTTVISCIVGLVASIFLWNQFLVSKGINLNTDRNVTASFGNQLMIGLNNYEIIKDFNQTELLNSKLLSNKEKKLLNNKKQNYYLININNLKGKTIGQKLILLDENNNISTTTSILFVLKQLLEHPYLVLESYTSNYLAIANIYPKETNDGVSYQVAKEFSLSYCHENCSIAVSVASKKSNISYMLDDAYQRVISYEQYNNSPIYIRYMLKGTSYVTTNLYKLILLILPFLSIFSIISFAKNNNDNRKMLSMVLILFWYSFLHILVHVATGANIDRYASPAYITTIIGIIIYLYYFINKRNIEVKRSDKNEKHKQRRNKR